MNAERIGVEFRGIAPQPVKPVVGPPFLSEDVDYELAVIEEYPVGSPLALDVEWPSAGLLELPLHLVGDRPHLAVAAGGADEKTVGV